MASMVSVNKGFVYSRQRIASYILRHLEYGDLSDRNVEVDVQEILRKQKKALVKERARSAFWEIVRSDEAEVATSNESAPVSPLKDATKVRWLRCKYAEIILYSSLNRFSIWNLYRKGYSFFRL
jgi:hypothetical protein